MEHPEATLANPDSPELTAALRKLLESKDAAVRAMIETTEDDTQ